MKTLIRFLFFVLGILPLHALGLPVISKKEMITPVPVRWTPGKQTDMQFRQHFKAGCRYSWEKISVETDRKGGVHTRFQQLFDGIPVKNAVIILHTGNGSAHAITGVLILMDETPSVSLNLAFKKQEITEKLLPRNGRLAEDIPGSGWYWLTDDSDNSIRLVFTLNYFPENSLHAHTVIADAATGAKIDEWHNSCYADVTGIAVTAYYGVKNISCFADSGRFYLRSTTRGQGIYTANLNNHLNYQHVSEFTDDDNYWQPGPPVNEIHATDAHYCAEQYYDFLNSRFNRNSLDNNGFRLKSYLNYGTALTNAFWNGQAVVYGSGNATTGPLTTTDIAGHEFTHGLIQKTANLTYSEEPGTINEAISDIFGAAVEWYSNPLQANWLIGEQSGTTLRSLNHPGDFNQPSAFHGNHWYYGTGDQGGVHINSGFISKWFYMLCNGEQGINEFGTSYNITGIGMVKSTDLIYHTLTSYLLSDSGFDELYQYTIQSALDLYGNCSPEYQAVLHAWDAAGFKNSNDSVRILLTGAAEFCAGDSVLIRVNHTPGSVYEWYHNGIPEVSGPTPELFVNTTGTWQVKVTRCGYQNLSDTIMLSHFPIVQVSAANIESCKGLPVDLAGYPSGGAFNIPDPYSGISTSYEYIVTDGNGCNYKAQGYIQVHNLPEVDLYLETIAIPQNATPLLLEANVPGTFMGNGVYGNQFFPDVTGPGGPWPVYLTYTDINGCTAGDSGFVEVIKPCIRESSNISITSSDSIIEPGQIISFHTNVSEDDFLLSWSFPEGCVTLGESNQNEIVVKWNSSEGTVVLFLMNTCNDTLQKEFRFGVHQLNALPGCALFPNPAKGAVTLQMTGEHELPETEIVIMDLTGKQVNLYRTGNSIQELNIENLASGTYIFEVRNGKTIIRKNLVVQ